MEKILIVDDDQDMRFNLSQILKEEGYDVIPAQDGREALEAVQNNSPNLALLDIRLPSVNGMEILEKLKRMDKDLLIIMLTAYVEVKDAVKAMKLGAYDYVTKPFDNEELILIIKKALQTQYLSREVEILRRRLGERSAIEEVMGESQQIKQVLKQVELIAPTNMTVIIQGESGTGKELVAQLIHQKSLHKLKPFVAIDCGAIPETLVESELFGYEKGAFTGAEERREGKFEQANNGTLLLDEITNLTDGIQMKLLRVLQERRLQHLGGKKDISIDVRIIVTSNVNLSEQVRKERFRDDLYHRLNEFQIELPLLRERKEDIPILAKYFLEEANNELNKKIKGFCGEVIKFFLNYSWPGNIRELKNLVKKAVLLSDSEEISPEHLSINHPAGAPSTTALKNTIQLQENSSFTPLEIPKLQGEKTKFLTGFKNITKEFEKEVIKDALAKAGGNKLKAAKILHINRKALYRKMKSLGL